MLAIAKDKLPKHLQFDYSRIKTPHEMNKIDGSVEVIQDMTNGGIYESYEKLHGDQS